MKQEKTIKFGGMSQEEVPADTTITKVEVI